MAGFYRGGHEAYVTAIREEYDSKLRSLKDKLRLSVDDRGRAVVLNEVRRVKTEMRIKLAKIRGSLF